MLRDSFRYGFDCHTLTFRKIAKTERGTSGHPESPLFLTLCRWRDTSLRIHAHSRQPFNYLLQQALPFRPNSFPIVTDYVPWFKPSRVNMAAILNAYTRPKHSLLCYFEPHNPFPYYNQSLRQIFSCPLPSAHFEGNNGSPPPTLRKQVL